TRPARCWRCSKRSCGGTRSTPSASPSPDPFVELLDRPLRGDRPVALLDPVEQHLGGRQRRLQRHRHPPGLAEAVAAGRRPLHGERVPVRLRPQLHPERGPPPVRRLLGPEEQEDLLADLDDGVAPGMVLPRLGQAEREGAHLLPDVAPAGHRGPFLTSVSLRSMSARMRSRASIRGTPAISIASYSVSWWRMEATTASVIASSSSA